MDDDMDFIFNKPNFSSWPISTSLQSLLLRENKWPDYFAIDPTALAPVLNTIYEQIKKVNFFNHPSETDLFFRFLRKLVESKPHDSRILNEFSNIVAEILDKLSLESRFDSRQEKVVIHYLNLLALMLGPNYRYLFEKAEISIWTNDFQKISNRSFNSSELLSKFRNTLQLSFQSRSFIKNYPALIRTINELACSLDKTHVDSNELAAMKLFDTLGVLDHTLKTSRIWSVKVNHATIKQSIQDTRNVLYDQFRPYVEENFLKYIFYKSFLAQSYPNSTNLTALCDSKNYRAQCKSDYIRYKDNYSCATDQLSHFFIDIKNNNCSKSDLDRLCVAMRNVESFVSWMEEFGFELNYNASEYVLHLADSKKNFLIDKFIFERDDPPEASHTVLATYFPPEKFSANNPLIGSAYTYVTELSALNHEYIHHLYALFVKDLELDLTLTEGIAELYAGGICPKRQINDLRNFVNDTFIFEFLKARRYPFYFNALKWVGYLINEDPELFKILVNYLQKNDLEGFYTHIDSFIGNTSNIDKFVVWSNQQVNLCNQYLNFYPDAHEQAIIYLDSIKPLLNLSETPSSPLPVFHSSRRMVKRSLNSANNAGVDELSKAWPLSLWSLGGGFFSAGLNDVGLANKESCPSLTAYINYGFRPFVFASVNAGLNSILFDETAEVEEKFARLFSYWVMGSLGVIIGQPLTQKMAEKIHNKLVCFFVQSLTWAMLWNPSLFITADSKILPVLFLQLLQGVLYKMGEETYQFTKRACNYTSSFWYRNELPLAVTEQNLNDEEIKQIANSL